MIKGSKFAWLQFLPRSLSDSRGTIGNYLGIRSPGLGARSMWLYKIYPQSKALLVANTYVLVPPRSGLVTYPHSRISSLPISHVTKSDFGGTSTYKWHIATGYACKIICAATEREYLSLCTYKSNL